MATKYEMSKTYQYRKVMKPLLERKRRARINKCLDDLKDLMAECMRKQNITDEEPSVKLEKADILELTVEHLQKLKTQRQQQRLTSRQTTTNSNSVSCTQQSFRAGFIHAANEVSRCLASFPNIDVALGTKLMTHLGLRLNQLEATTEVYTAVNSPLSINCNSSSSYNNTVSSTHTTITTAPLYSPVSSGYASDYDSSRSSPALSMRSQGLLQVSAPVWRPW